MESIGKFALIKEQQEELQSIILNQVQILLPSIFETITPFIINYTKTACTEHLITQQAPTVNHREKENIISQNRINLNNALNKREKLFQQCHRASRLTDLYQEGLEEEVPYVPRKFRKDKTHTRNQNEIPTLQHLNIQRCIAECEILKIRTENFKSEIKHIDDEIINNVNSLTDSQQTATEIIHMYNDFASMDECDVIKKWDRKIESLKKAFKRDRELHQRETPLSTQPETANNTIFIPETQEQQEYTTELTSQSSDKNKCDSSEVNHQLESPTKNFPSTRMKTRKKMHAQQ